MLCVNRKDDESRQIHLQTFRKISSRRMRELGSGSLIEIVVLDVDKLRKLVLLNLEL
jgi:hypothetical protein